MTITSAILIWLVIITTLCVALFASVRDAWLAIDAVEELVCALDDDLNGDDGDDDPPDDDDDDDDPDDDGGGDEGEPLAA